MAIAENGKETVVAEEDRLNVLSTANVDEVEEVERLLNPKPEVGKDFDDSADDDPLDDERDQTGKSDEELEGAGSDAEREKIRERRRQERRDKRSRHKDRIETLQRQLQNEQNARKEMSQRLLQLEQSNTGTQYAGLQQAESQAADAIDTLENALATAVSKNDGQTVVAAQRKLEEVRKVMSQIQAAKGQMERRAAQPQQPHLDKTAVNNARAFAQKHSWYKGPQGIDMDTRMLNTLDNAMTAEGWDPSTSSYWEELEKRMGTYIPHRVGKNLPARDNSSYTPADGGKPRESQRSPVAGSSGGSAGAGGKATFRVSEERVRAMKEAGIWDDLVRRDKMIKRYQAQDKQNS